MTPTEAQQSAAIAHLTCVYCQEPCPVDAYDRDLDGMVCHDFRKKLLGASAWLKKSGMPYCQRETSQ